MRSGVIISVGDFSIEKKRRSYLSSENCRHLNMEMSDDGYTVTCKDCNKQLSAYFVLEFMIDSIDSERMRVNQIEKKLKEERSAINYLRASKHMESIWRTRDTLPTCPHCKEGITAEDALKIGICSKSLHIQKMKNKESKQ